MTIRVAPAPRAMVTVRARRTSWRERQRVLDRGSLDGRWTHSARGMRSSPCVRTCEPASTETPTERGSVSGVKGRASGADIDRVGRRRWVVALARHHGEYVGLSIRQIADRLGRSPATVRAYLVDPRRRGRSRTGTWGVPRLRRLHPAAQRQRRPVTPPQAPPSGAIARRWTQDHVLDAMRDWLGRYGGYRRHTTGRVRTRSGERQSRASPRESGRRRASSHACSVPGALRARWPHGELGRSSRRSRSRRPRHLAGSRSPYRNPGNPPQKPRISGEVSRSRNPSICRYFVQHPQISPIIRVGEVPGSNPGAPINLAHLQGFYGGRFSSVSIPMDSRYRVGTFGSRQLHNNEIPAIPSHRDAVASSILRPRDVPAAVAAEWPKGVLIAVFVRAGGTSLGGLPAQSLPKLEPRVG
jgi:hypothetical protein